MGEGGAADLPHRGGGTLSFWGRAPHLVRLTGTHGGGALGPPTDTTDQGDPPIYLPTSQPTLLAAVHHHNEQPKKTARHRHLARTCATPSRKGKKMTNKKGGGGSIALPSPRTAHEGRPGLPLDPAHPNKETTLTESQMMAGKMDQRFGIVSLLSPISEGRGPRTATARCARGPPPIPSPLYPSLVISHAVVGGVSHVPSPQSRTRACDCYLTEMAYSMISRFLDGSKNVHLVGRVVWFGMCEIGYEVHSNLWRAKVRSIICIPTSQAKHLFPLPQNHPRPYIHPATHRKGLVPALRAHIRLVAVPNPHHKLQFVLLRFLADPDVKIKSVRGRGGRGRLLAPFRGRPEGIGLGHREEHELVVVLEVGAVIGGAFPDFGLDSGGAVNAVQVLFLLLLRVLFLLLTLRMLLVREENLCVAWGKAEWVGWLREWGGGGARPLSLFIVSSSILLLLFQPMLCRFCLSPPHITKPYVPPGRWCRWYPTAHCS